MDGGFNKIRVLIADDVEETRINLEKLLHLEEDIAVVGHARCGKKQWKRPASFCRMWCSWTLICPG